MENSSRKLRNFLIYPLWQTHLALYNIALSIIFSFIIGFIFYKTYFNIYEIITKMTDIQSEIKEIMLQNFNTIFIWIIILIVCNALATIVISIIFTHRLFGPAVAFKRHIQKLISGDYQARIYLRKKDAFQDIAHELNNLSEILEKKYKSTHHE